MKVLYGHSNKINEPTAIAFGKFDGLHEGHRLLLGKLITEAKSRDLQSLVYTFLQHPANELYNQNIKLLMTNHEKEEQLKKLGIDILVFEDFNLKFAKSKPEEFVKDILVDKLNCKLIVMGENSTFGKDKSGNIEMMQRLGNKYNFDVIKIELKKDSTGEVISSTKIRNESIGA